MTAVGKQGKRRKLAMPPDPFTFVGQILEQRDDGMLVVLLGRDEHTFHVEEGSRFITLTGVIDPFEPQEATS